MLDFLILGMLVIIWTKMPKAWHIEALLKEIKQSEAKKVPPLTVDRLKR